MPREFFFAPAIPAVTQMDEAQLGHLRAQGMGRLWIDDVVLDERTTCPSIRQMKFHVEVKQRHSLTSQ